MVGEDGTEREFNAEEVLEQIKSCYSQDNISFFTKTTLKLYENSIKDKVSLDSLVKHNLVFIGKTQVGKSTNICSVFDFCFNNGGKREQMLPSDKGGTTTPCTVEIDNVGENTCIEIFNIDDALLEKYLLAFIQKEKEIDSAESLPEEIQTIIRNKIESDELYQRIDINDDMETIGIHIKNLVKKYHNENSIKVNYLEKDTGIDSTYKWIKLTIDEIRRGQNEYVFIPFKIVVHISKVTKELPYWVNKIVDTRGISTASSSKKNEKKNGAIRERVDLTEYIQNKESIIVFLTDYANLDDNIKEYYEDLLTSINTDLWEISRHMVLISTSPGMIESKVTINKSRNKVIGEKIKSFEGLMFDFANELKHSDSDRDLQSFDIFSNLKKKTNYFNMKMLDVILYEAKKYTDEEEYEAREEKVRLNREGIQELLADKIVNIHRLLENEINQLCDDAISIVNSKTVKEKINKTLERSVVKFKEYIQNDAEESVRNYIHKYIARFLEVSSYLPGMTWRAYTNSDGYVISRDGSIVGDTTLPRNEIMEDLSREITILLIKATKALELELRESKTNDEDLDSFLHVIREDIINRAKTELVKELQKQFEMELKIRILNNNLLWEEVFQQYQKGNRKYSDIGKGIILTYLSSDFLLKGILYNKYNETNFNKAKVVIKEKMLKSLEW